MKTTKTKADSLKRLSLDHLLAALVRAREAGLTKTEIRATVKGFLSR